MQLVVGNIEGTGTSGTLIAHPYCRIRVGYFRIRQGYFLVERLYSASSWRVKSWQIVFTKSQLAVVVAQIAHQLGHHAACFLPTAVWILKFCAADVRAKRGKKHRNEGFVHVFWGLREQDFVHFVPLPSFGIAGAVALLISYIIVYQPFRRIIDAWVWQLQLWQFVF